MTFSPTFQRTCQSSNQERSKQIGPFRPPCLFRLENLFKLGHAKNMLETTCVIPECSRPGAHVLPKDKDRRMQWIRAIRRGKPTYGMWEPSGIASCVGITSHQMITRTFLSSLLLPPQQRTGLLFSNAFVFCPCLKNHTMDFTETLRDVWPHDLGVQWDIGQRSRIIFRCLFYLF